MTLTNQERVIRCREAIANYSDDDDYTNLVDFLADAMHFCQLHGHSFQETLSSATMHFEAERDGDDNSEDFNQSINQRKDPTMKRYHITVIVKTLEVYQVDAENEEEAEENWAEGTIIRTDDSALENEILTIKEVKP